MLKQIQRGAKSSVAWLRACRKPALAALLSVVQAPAILAQPTQLVHAQARKNNAVKVYVMAITEARRVFTIQAAHMLNLPVEASALGYTSEFWVDSCNQAAVARSLFAQASCMSFVEFADLPTGRTQLVNMSPLLWQLRTLVFAHGMQNAVENPDIAISDAVTLLRHARHLCGGTATDGLALGYVAEENALQLIESVLPAARCGLGCIERCRVALEEHRKLRVTLPQIAEVVRAETMRRLKVVPGLLDDEKARVQVVARLNKILRALRHPGDSSPQSIGLSIAEDAARWSVELVRMPRRIPTDTTQRLACVRSLKLPAMSGFGALLRRHSAAADRLVVCLKKLSR